MILVSYLAIELWDYRALGLQQLKPVDVQSLIFIIHVYIYYVCVFVHVW